MAIREATKPSTKTLASLAYDRLRGDIMGGVLQPGQRLRFNALCEHYGCAVGTLREALQKLAADGLVAAEERQGFVVENMSAAQLDDAASMRILLEEEGLRRSIRHGDVEWEVSLVGTFRRLESREEAARSGAQRLDEEWQTYHRNFHWALISACGSPNLLQLRDIVFGQNDRYYRLFFRSQQHSPGNLAEHRAIRDAALARDADRAAMLLRRHLEGTTQVLLEWFSHRGLNGAG